MKADIWPGFESRPLCMSSVDATAGNECTRKSHHELNVFISDYQMM